MRLVSEAPAVVAESTGCDTNMSDHHDRYMRKVVTVIPCGKLSAFSEEELCVAERTGLVKLVVIHVDALV